MNLARRYTLKVLWRVLCRKQVRLKAVTVCHDSDILWSSTSYQLDDWKTRGLSPGVFRYSIVVQLFVAQLKHICFVVSPPLIFIRARAVLLPEFLALANVLVIFLTSSEETVKIPQHLLLDLN